MEFAKPLLSLTRWKLNTLAVTPSANQPQIPTGPQPASTPQDTASTNGFCTAYVNVFTLRKVRTRVGSKLRPAEHPAAAAAPALASRPLHAQPDTAPQQTPPILKIVQREPRKQPECLLISGRMADVCAALERMARNERALHA